MKRVLFNGIDLLTSFFLVYETHTVTEATPKTNYISIPFSDGSLDLTESMGSVNYDDLSLEISFGAMQGDFDDIESRFKNEFSGQKIKINFDGNDHYYYGRLVSVAFSRDRKILRVSCNFVCDPYRLKNELTVITVHSTSTEVSLIVTNEKKKSVPVFETDDSIQVKFGTNSWSINEGVHTLPIILQKGDNELKISGEATVKISYQEGTL